MSRLCRRLVPLVLLCAGARAARAEPPVYLLNSPFEVGTEFQPTSIYAVDPANGVMTLKADIGTLHTPCLGLAAASATVLYAACTDHEPVEVDGDDTCFNCELVRVVLDPLSTVPTEILEIGRIRDAGATVEQISGLTFREDGALYAVTEIQGGESLYTVDLAQATATRIGNVTEGCTTTVLDVQGGDITFDSLDRLWLWTNHLVAPPSGKGIWEIDPATGCATQSVSCSGGPNFSGFAAIGHLDADTHLRALSTSASPRPDRLYTLSPGECPSSFESLTLDGEPFDQIRGDLDSPFCESDASCEDGNPCTADVCSPGGCRHDGPAVNGSPCDDGDGTTCTDVCDSGICAGTQVPEPEEVDGSVRLGKATGGVSEIAWDGGSGTFHVYRGSRDAGAAFTYNQTCLQSDLSAPPATDGQDPAPQSLFYYLVSRVDACRESVLGRNSAGSPDPNLSPCP